LTACAAVATATPAAAQQKEQPSRAERYLGAKKKPTHHRRYRGDPAERISRNAYNPSLCGVINGWRAFPTRDRSGYFDTRSACCCR
jgi:hypothetical protein